MSNAASKRRIWRLRPSSSTISSHALRVARAQQRRATSRAGARRRRRCRLPAPRATPSSGMAIDLHVVGLVGPGRGIGDARGPCGIVAEQQQAFARLVQAAHRREPRQARVVETAIDGVATALVLRGRHQAARLVQRDAETFDGAHRDRAHPRRCDAGRRWSGIQGRGRRGRRRPRVRRGSTAWPASANTRRAWTARARVRDVARRRPPGGGITAVFGVSVGAGAGCAGVPGAVAFGRRRRRGRRPGPAAGALPPFATRTPRAFIQASNSSAVMRLPFWLMSNRHGVLSNCVCGL